MIDELWPQGPRFKSQNGVFRLTTDSVMLAYFAKTTRVKRAFDIGCGTAVIAILLALKNPALVADGIDINSDAINLARENIRLSNLENRISVTHGDMRIHRELFAAGSYDLVVSNPPYYAGGRGKPSQDEAMRIARGEELCTIDDVCSTAQYLTRWGGSFSIVHKPDRLAEVICALTRFGFEPKRMRFVQYKASYKPSLVLIDSRRGGNPLLSIDPPLILVNDDGSDTKEARAIYRR